MQHRGHADDCTIQGQGPYAGGPCDCAGFSSHYESLPRKVVREMKRRGFGFVALAANNQDVTSMLFGPDGREYGQPFICHRIDVTGLEQMQNEGVMADDLVRRRVHYALGCVAVAWRNAAVSSVEEPLNHDPIHAAIGAIHKQSKHRI
jgi:hypothetical protein